MKSHQCSKMNPGEMCTATLLTSIGPDMRTELIIELQERYCIGETNENYERSSFNSYLSILQILIKIKLMILETGACCATESLLAY